MDLQRELARYMALCSRREYAGYDIVSTLKRRGVSQQEAEELLKKLKESGFVDDRRYVTAFVRDKVLLAGWGGSKVEYQLRMKGFTPALIAEAFEELDKEDAGRRMEDVITRKYNSLKNEADQIKKRAKVIRFALSRGFSYDQVGGVLSKLENKED